MGVIWLRVVTGLLWSTNSLRTLLLGRGPLLPLPPHKKLWKHLWKLKVPLKVQHFMLQLAQNILPTRDVLFKHKITHNVTCFWCPAQDCALISQVWDLLGWDSYLNGLPRTDAASWLLAA
ncbi:unnamed protein product [Prunus armeniaca]